MKNSYSTNRDKRLLDAGLLKKVKDAINIPDPERAAKIRSLKEQIQKGTYTIDADKVARSMLKDLIKDL